MVAAVSHTPHIPMPTSYPETAPLDGYVKGVFNLLDRLGAGGKSLKVDYIATGTLEVADGERSILVTGLNHLGREVTELLRKDQNRSEDLHKQLGRLSKVNMLQTSIGVFSTAIGVAAGIATGGAAGVALVLGALLNGAHQVAQRTDFYHTVAGSMTNSSDTQTEISDALATYIGYLCFAATLGSLAVGGTEIAKKGFEEATKVSLQGMSDVSTLGQGLAGIVETRIGTKRLELQAAGILINLTLSQLGRKREEDTNRFGEVGKVEEAAFDAANRRREIEAQTNQKITRGK